ncbi:hypothetical protein ACUXZ5_04175 [Alloscardovia omnicolens]|uniref:hypothetical protein n=1 Tax=Alloscardovia omnicolens TaxID=419015 RepID=UPI004055601B
MTNDVNASLRLVHAISKENRPYDYVAVVVDSQEIARLFLKPLEIKYLFDTSDTSTIL